MPIMSAVWMPCAAPPAPWSTAPHARKSPSRCTVWRTVMPWKPWDFGSKSWMCLAIPLATLPGNTRVCCPHEYPLSNLKFARAVEPGNAALLHYSSQCEALRARHQPTLPSLMALEQDINPFLRVRQPAVAQAAHGYDAKVNQDDAVAVLAALRQWKNEFR